jgi:hypothetical protein
MLPSPAATENAQSTFRGANGSESVAVLSWDHHDAIGSSARTASTECRRVLGETPAPRDCWGVVPDSLKYLQETPLLAKCQSQILVLDKSPQFGTLSDRLNDFSRPHLLLCHVYFFCSRESTEIEGKVSIPNVVCLGLKPMFP